MSAAAPGKVQISFQVTDEQADILAKRAARLDWRRGKFAGAIIANWFARGCPAINDMEMALAYRDSLEETGTEKKG